MSDRRTHLARIAVENPELLPVVLPLLRDKVAAPQAKDRYEDNTRAIKALLREITAGLVAHEREFKTSGSTNWGFVGDVGHIHELLKEVRDFLYNAEG